MNTIAILSNRATGAFGHASNSPRTGPNWFVRGRTAVWRALEDVGRARARRGLWALAERCSATQPELAKSLRAAADRDPAV